jgi:hypothetical protein
MILKEGSQDQNRPSPDGQLRVQIVDHISSLVI